MIDLLTLLTVIHECNILAGQIVLPPEIAAHCSWHYEYALQNYFAGDYESYRIMYEEFEKMYNQQSTQ